MKVICIKTEHNLTTNEKIVKRLRIYEAKKTSDGWLIKDEYILNKLQPDTLSNWCPFGFEEFDDYFKMI